jgi:hypothetical protein
VLVDHFSQRSADRATGSAAEQPTQDRSGQSAAPPGPAAAPAVMPIAAPRIAPAAPLAAPATVPMVLPAFFPKFLLSIRVDRHWGQLRFMGNAPFLGLVLKMP